MPAQYGSDSDSDIQTVILRDSSGSDPTQISSPGQKSPSAMPDTPSDDSSYAGLDSSSGAKSESSSIHGFDTSSRHGSESEEEEPQKVPKC